MPSKVIVKPAALPVRKNITHPRWLNRFCRDESGVLVGFAVFLFLIILMVGGIGIDIMRSEMNRTRMQHTLDRAILAAADMGQPLKPEAVVQDYFTKSGLSDTLTFVQGDTGLNYREVTARAETTTNTRFMHLAGVETLTAAAGGRAEERIGGVEISLVLDVSGSMNSNSRLYNLKTAAKDFIDTMDANTEDGKLSISVVPYATQVSVPEHIFETLNASLNGSMDVDTTVDPDVTEAQIAANQHNYSYCLHFDGADFTSTALNPTDRWTQAVHFSPWSDYDGRSRDKLVSTPVCRDRDATSSAIMALEKQPTALKSYIDGLWASGNTSIDIGMKWGVALLDPSTRPIVDNLIAKNDVSTDFSERPYRYTDAESLKVVVLMTDGENTSQYYVNEQFRQGASNIWWNVQEGKYSVYLGLDEGDDDHDGITEEMIFYWPHSGEWVDHPYGNGTSEEEVTETDWVCSSYRRNGSCRRYQKVYTTTTIVVDEPGEAVELSYPELWGYTSLEWNVEEHYEPWMYDSNAWDDWFYDVREYVGTTTKNARTKAICDAAKDKDIIVFTIGFEAPYGGQTVLKDCASSDAHYFDVNGLEISDAFSAIASSIAQLKLTQ